MTMPGQEQEEASERRLGDPLMLAIKSLQASLDKKHPENLGHMVAIEKEVIAVKGKVDLVLSGFPDNDPEAHRRYHESIIEWRELRNKMVKEALIKMAGAGALGGVGWLAYAIWQAFRISVKQ